MPRRAKQTEPVIEWLTLDEAAVRLCISTRTVRRWISSGELDARRFVPRLIRVSSLSLDRFGKSLQWAA
jgi:excisionase family DNA binding protein